MGNVQSSILLQFDPSLNRLDKDKELRDGLSAVVQTGNQLWLASDETASLESLITFDGGSTFKDHRSFPLDQYIDLPAEVEQEIDIEGLSFNDNYLWIVGSHSLKRSKPKGNTAEKDIKRLAKVKRDGNRYLLARIPLVQENGVYQLVKQAADPSDSNKTLYAARLRGDMHSNMLMDALKDDEHLAPFLSIPGKDNGFDIEGLALVNKKVFIGLRGPVLRGWAIVLEIEVEEHSNGYLSLREIGENNQLYKKHFINLDGLGIREIIADDVDLLIMAGPSMDLDGPVAIYKWEKGALSLSESLINHKEMKKIIDLPYGIGDDHPEGMTLFSSERYKRSILVTYDAIANSRKQDVSGVLAEVFELPQTEKAIR
jgi:hypothetical protein